MKDIILPLSDRPKYSAKQLTIADTSILQTLYDRNRDFALLTYGKPFSTTAARDEFNDLPPGKSPEDIHVFGLFDPEHSLIGAIVAVKNYPDESTWWLGLMMIAPEVRNKGLGSSFYKAFENWVAAQNIFQISLCVIEANHVGLKFWHKMGLETVRQTDAKPYGDKTHMVYVLNKKITAKIQTIPILD